VCPICLDEAEHPLNTNCGHLLCGGCFVQLYARANATDGVKCPVCRRNVVLMVGVLSAYPDAIKEKVIFD